MKTSCPLLKFSVPIWLYLLHITDALSVLRISDDSENEDLTQSHAFLIFPGTKWCGPGNISSSYDDLGEARKTDICCREHDYCPDLIEAGQTKHNLTNNHRFTRLSCTCDEKFYDCLKGNMDKTSDEVGVLYFDAISTQCFKKAYPIVNCTQHNIVLRNKCEKYVLDETKPERYQWFDVPVYTPKHLSYLFSL